MEGYIQAVSLIDIPNKGLDDSDFSELQFNRTFNASVSSGFLYCRAIYGGMIVVRH